MRVFDKILTYDGGVLSRNGDTKVSHYRTIMHNLKANPGLRFAFALYANLTFIFVVYAILVYKQYQLSRKLSKAEQPEKQREKRIEKEMRRLRKDGPMTAGLDLISPPFSPEEDLNSGIEEHEIAEDEAGRPSIPNATALRNRAPLTLSNTPMDDAPRRREDDGE